MTRKHTINTQGLRAMTLAAAVGAALMLAPAAMAGQEKKPAKRAQFTQQSGVTAKQKAAPVRTAAARGQQNGRTDAQRRDHDRGDGAGGRRRDHNRGEGRDGRGRGHDRGREGHGRSGGGWDHDRKPDDRHWDRKDRSHDTKVVVVVGDCKPAPCTNLLGTIHINDICVDVRKDHVFEAFREAARCAGYRTEKVKVNGRSYLRVYGCPRVDFKGSGYELDVIRYHNDVIDIALYREVC